MALLGKVSYDCFVGIRTVSCHVGVCETIKGVVVPCLNGVQPGSLDQEAKTGMVETHKGANAGEFEGLWVVGNAGSWAVMAMAWVASYRKTMEMTSQAALLAWIPWLGKGWRANMVEDGTTETRIKGGRSAAGGGETLRGNCHSQEPSRLHQPLRMGWPSGWKTFTDVLSKTILQPWLAKGPRPMRVWGKDGMTWPNIIAGGSAETKASVALATERLGHPFATVMLTVGARGL